MRISLPTHHSVLPGGECASSREGRDSERSWRATVLLLFPRLDARPGPWALLLVAVCGYVVVRILESGGF
jgi:hypothetical protein